MTNPGGNERSALRGEVYLANLLQLGGRLWKHRPVLIVQNDRANRNSPETIALAIRSDGGRRHPIHVPAARGTGGLDRNSLVDAGQILTFLQSQLGRRLGMMPPEIMKAVDEALRVSLGLI